MLRLFKAALLACALATASLAQAAAVGQTPPGVTVRGFEWRARHKTVRQSNNGLSRRGDYASNDPMRPGRREQNQRAPGMNSGRLDMPDAPVRPARRVLHGYESSLHIRNDGAKAITAVEWEHVFFEDVGRRKELRRFGFKSDANVGPGEQKFIAQVMPSAGLKLPARSRQGVVIKRVLYADGSVWERQ